MVNVLSHHRNGLTRGKTNTHAISPFPRRASYRS
jgi:hypothetical protein